jgi:hypothetical protein
MYRVGDKGGLGLSRNGMLTRLQIARDKQDEKRWYHSTRVCTRKGKTIWLIDLS